MVAMASVAALLAALDHQQTLGEAAPLEMETSVAASLAAQDPQLALDGAALVALVLGNHWQAPCWAALMTSHWQAEC